MYETINDVPDVLKDFYHEVTYQDLVAPATYGDEGEVLTEALYEPRIEVELVSRPETKVMADLERVITLGKPQKVLDKFAEMVALGEQWTWFDSYEDWEMELYDVLAYNEDLPVVAQTEEGEDIYAEPKLLPIEPVRPVVRTSSDVLAPYQRDFFKKDRAKQVQEIKVTVDSMIFDGDEESQTRMTRAIVALDVGETMLWVLADNSVAYPTKEQLKQALRLAGEEQALIWVDS